MHNLWVLELKSEPRTVVAGLSIEFRGDQAIDERGRMPALRDCARPGSLKAGQTFRSPASEEIKAVLPSSVVGDDYPAAVVEEHG